MSLVSSSGKLPPHNLDAEEAVIGSVLIDGELVKSVRCSSADFYHENHAIIFKAMLELKEKGTAINQITVAQKLAEQEKLEEVGGASILSHLISICPTSLDCDYYADIVKRLSTCRQMIVASDMIASLAYSAPEDIAGTLSKADSLLLELRKRVGTTDIITPDDRAQLLMNRYEKLYENEKGVALKTGLIDLDKRLGGGLFPGDFIVVGARPGLGKTTFIQCIANHVGLTNNVLFCSAEMNVEGLSDRDVAGHLGIPIETIRFGGFSFDVYENIVGQAIPYISKLNLYHMDITRVLQINTANIYQTAYELLNRRGLSLIVIDYLGLLSDKYGQNNNDRLGYISRNLKQMALSLNVPILCAHQLNRALEGREEKRPQLSDLRDSGNIEQDADVVLFMYRDSYYNKQTDNNVTEVAVAKQRQGSSAGGIKILWDDVHHTYVSLAREEPTTEKMI